MKTRRIQLVFAFLITLGLHSPAQSKKDIEQNLQKCSNSRDSIQVAFSNLSIQYDSLAQVAAAYDTMYMALKTKIILKDFNPSKMASIIDSIRSGGTNNEFGALVTINDSLTILRLDNKRLNETIKMMNTAVSERTVVIYDLRQLKQLLDENIITQLEFNDKKAKLIMKL